MSTMEDTTTSRRPEPHDRTGINPNGVHTMYGPIDPDSDGFPVIYGMGPHALCLALSLQGEATRNPELQKLTARVIASWLRPFEGKTPHDALLQLTLNTLVWPYFDAKLADQTHDVMWTAFCDRPDVDAYAHPIGEACVAAMGLFAGWHDDRHHVAYLGCCSILLEALAKLHADRDTGELMQDLLEDLETIGSPYWRCRGFATEPPDGPITEVRLRPDAQGDATTTPRRGVL